MFGIDDLALGIIGGSVISALGGVASSALSSASASAANGESYKYTKALQKDQQAFNAAQASLAYERQRSLYDYQVEKQGQQYQRAVKDLRAAGINPLLAVGGMSGSTPSPSSVAQASSSSGGVHATPPDWSGISHSANAIANLVSGIPQMAANLENTKASTEKEKALTEEAKARKDKLSTETQGMSPTAERIHSWASTAKDIATPIASAYGAKKGVEVATKVMKSAGIRNAKDIAKTAVPAAVGNSAKSAVIFGSRLVPAAALSYGIYRGLEGARTKHWKEVARPIAQRQGYHGWH